MRKIEAKMIDTINKQQSEADGKPTGIMGVIDSYVFGNTWVRTAIREDLQIVTTVYLHGNMIAQFSGNNWGFKMCGWPTNTTKSRINALAAAFGRDGVYTKDGKHYSGDKEINAYDWF